MHPCPIFRNAEAEHSLAFISVRNFGVLAMNADPAPLFAHIPFLLNDDPRHVDLHLVCSNSIARALKDGQQKLKLAVTAPNSYISADLYVIDDQVPTWNYLAMHFIGQLELQRYCQVVF